jgi:hypothetical protein
MGIRPSRVCHFARLSSIECQLVLQMLDSSSRLRAARCCRSLLRDADNPFAWRGGECTFFVSSGGSHGDGDATAKQLQLLASSLSDPSPEHLQLQLLLLLEQSLLRHAEQLRLVCREGDGGSSGAPPSSWRGLSNASIVARLRAAPSDPTTDARLCQLLRLAACEAAPCRPPRLNASVGLADPRARFPPLARFSVPPSHRSGLLLDVLSLSSWNSSSPPRGF